MNSPITALVLGAGKFGRNYAVILSELNSKKPADVPEIEKLIVSRTRLNRALDLAEQLRRNENCRLRDIIGVEVAEKKHLLKVLAKYRPHFTAITARDMNLGDSVHAHYAAEAIRYGAVLCEKPFCHAHGDGRSLRYFRELKKSEYSAFFGLELPMVVVAQEMLQNKQFHQRLMKAERLEFYWSARDAGDHNVIDDLILHPWSLIPPQFKTRPIDVRDQGTRADIRIELHNPLKRQPVICRMRLRTGGRFRGMMIDDLGIRFTSRGGLITMIQLERPLSAAAADPDEFPQGEVLLQVDNPLKHHIVAVLRGHPIVGLSRARQSQLFLETLRGYRPRDRLDG